MDVFYQNMARYACTRINEIYNSIILNPTFLLLAKQLSPIDEMIWMNFCSDLPIQWPPAQ